MKRLLFMAMQADDGTRDGEEGWQVFIDLPNVSQEYIDTVSSDNLDIGETWFVELMQEKFGITIEFDYE